MVSTSSAQEPTDISVLEAQAQTLVREFVSTLKPALKGAMQEGGPVHAIDVCAVKAPDIASTLSAQTGWEVSRVSLKTRNPEAKPDEWERKQLKAFEQRQKSGESAESISTQLKTESEFRYMQAQGTGGLCLTCHGENVAPEVQAKLDELYPKDRATGYQAGDIRGAISLVKRFPPE
ncbi:MAG: Tll0287-like domain-containing protein [Pseudomonadota bacterium]